MIDWDVPKLPPLEQLHAEAELLRQVQYWRTKHDELLYTLRAIAAGALKA